MLPLEEWCEVYTDLSVLFLQLLVNLELFQNKKLKKIKMQTIKVSYFPILCSQYNLVFYLIICACV